MQIVTKDYQGQAITYQDDGWFNATQAAAKFGKRAVDWLALQSTKEYIAEYIAAFKAHNPEVRKTHFAKRGVDSMSLDIMIDLETLGTTADAVIVSIGAVRFDLEATPGTPFASADDCFYVVCSVDSQADRHISRATQEWWWQQSEQARSVFDQPSTNITLALIGLGAFICCTLSRPNVWSNGADFDLPMLAHAYRQYGVALPWKPYAGRCYRTYKNLPGARAIPMQRAGTHHNALDDAIDQAQHLCAIHQALFGAQGGAA